MDCGGCNGCEIEIFATLSPLFDAERFGIKVVPSPRHADILLFTGAVTRAMRSPALRARSLRRIRKSASPTVPAATAAASSTIFTASGAAPTKSCRWTGCPPTPAATLYGFAMALGLLEQKIHARERELDNQPATAPGHEPHGTQAGGLPLRTPDCRRLSASAQPGDHQVARWLEAENDPRLNEIVANLNNIVDEARIR